MIIVSETREFKLGDVITINGETKTIDKDLFFSGEKEFVKVEKA